MDFAIVPALVDCYGQKKYRIRRYQKHSRPLAVERRMPDPEVKPEVKIFDYDKIEIGEELGSYEYTLTQDMLDNFRASINDPDAVFPTLAVKHDATAFAMVYEDNTGGVNAGNEVEFFNPPIPGKKIRVTGRIADKYLRRDKPYMVIEATAVDEDGRLLEKLRTYQMKKPDEVGKKWHPQT